MRVRYWGRPDASVWVDYQKDEEFPAIVVAKGVDIARFFDAHHAILFCQLYNACGDANLTPKIVLDALRDRITELKRKSEKGIT